jgi:peptidyl-prolyl cis-trans isomerase C
MKSRFTFCIVTLIALSPVAVAGESLVRWRDLELTTDDYQAALRGIPPDKRYEFQTDLKRITGLLENMLVYRTLAAEGKALGLNEDPLSKKEVELAAERNLGLKRMQIFEESIKVPDLTAAAREVYDANPEKFKSPDMVDANHILIDPALHGGWAEGRARAEEVLAKVKAGGNFGELAITYSDDANSARRNGYVGAFPRGRMAKSFEDAAFALREGEISGLVESSFGYHIIKVNRKLPATAPRFDEVKDGLILEARNKFIAQKKLDYFSTIKSDPSIILNTKAIDKLKLENPLAKDQPK